MNIAVFASGAGTTIDYLLTHSHIFCPRIIKLVVTNNPVAKVLSIAEKHNVATYKAPLKNFASFDAWDQHVLKVLKEQNIAAILLCGFLKPIGPLLLSAYDRKVVNSHPSLLPKYGGKGMYGIRVHNAVIADKCKESGATIHLVNGEYDKGEILKQVLVPIESNETAESLEEKVKWAEKKALLEFLSEWNI